MFKCVQVCSSSKLTLPTTDRLKPVETGIFILGVSTRRAPRKIWTKHPPTEHLIGSAIDFVTLYHGLFEAVNLAHLPPPVYLPL